ncbi:amidase domain-containing protein [Mycolicibacterium komossense]|uniref:Amidase domain-containing protein n=1 Tax=Mycolicibacterium komossense TaxID=1779 RepID=A0ABT3CM65_9MYCO|nr:amidase domain-containing protein [Mycolicibacterium komossense]MCV7230486.1 amidase domain-containing protein [Mycolicibacterium komossense]
MVTFGELRGAKPGAWSSAADDFLAAAKQCERIKDDIHDNGVRPLDAHWTGIAYGRARDVLTQVADRAEVVSIFARSAVDPLDTLNHAVETAQRELENAIVMARNAGLDVDDVTGQVSIPPGTPTSEINEMTRVGQTAARLIDDAVEAATQADDACSSALGATINADTPGATKDVAQSVQADNTKKALTELRDTIPDGLPPEAVAQWWNGLTQKEQSDLERACPTELSDLPGIPDSVKTAIDRPDLGYSSVGAVRYARDNYHNDSLDWPGKDNCTNFASDALAYGGRMPQKQNSYTLPRWDDDGWYDGTRGDPQDPLPRGLTHTRSWGGAQANHDFFLHHGGTAVSADQARPGDLAYFTATQETGGLHPGETHHAAIVTGVLPDGQILYTQHSEGALNYPLSGRLPAIDQELGQQQIEIVRPKVTW